MNPYLTVWNYPRETIRHVVAHTPSYHYFVIAMISGIGQVFEQARIRDAGAQFSLDAIVLGAVIMGPLVGLISLIATSWLIFIVGKKLRGIATFKEIQAAMGWSVLPHVVAILLILPALSSLGADYFRQDISVISLQDNIKTALSVSDAARLLLAIWSIILICKMVAEVQGFKSAWKGLTNVMVANLILALFVLVLLVLLKSLA